MSALIVYSETYNRLTFYAIAWLPYTYFPLEGDAA